VPGVAELNAHDTRKLKGKPLTGGFGDSACNVPQDEQSRFAQGARPNNSDKDISGIRDFQKK
jgi:hypothetical protein